MSGMLDQSQLQTERDLKAAMEIFVRDEKLGMLSDEKSADIVGQLTIAIAINRVTAAIKDKD